ncbi:MAG: LiaI-LiaF-like domain-containing protein [Terriglobia bacterium]
MKCLKHPETDAVGYCRQCGKALCTECRREIRSVLYCEDCLASTVLPGGGQPAAPGAPNPGVALVLGFIPGVGAVYNGEYAKALIYILIFGGFISVLSSGAVGGAEPLVGLLLTAFIIYMPIEAYQTAKRRAAGLAPAAGGWEALGFGQPGGGKGTPIGPLLLILLGTVFLFNTLDIFHFYWFRYMWRFWPLILIALGAWLLWKRAARPTQ